MNSQTYSFKIGNFDCIAVSDGNFTYAPPTFPPPAPFLFTNAPKEQLVPALQEHDLNQEQWKEWVSPYICLFINTGEHKVLVDTGAADLSPSTGKLLHNLNSEGIKPEDIDTIIITHGHPDHIGGNTNSEGKLVFPNARYIMGKEEWDFWNSEEAALKLDEHSREVLMGYAHKNLPPIRSRLDTIDKETEILPGIHAINATGHMPGQIVLSISSGSEQLLCVSDLVLHPIHLEHPEWLAAVDLIPDKVEATRREILARAASEKALVLAFHFPFPGLGYVSRAGGAYKWQPWETSA